MPKFTPNARNPLPLCVQEYLTQSHEEGTRNDDLHKAAQQCFWAKIPIADISGQLLARAMQDGLSEEEAKSAINSGYNSSDRPKASCRDLHPILEREPHHGLHNRHLLLRPRQHQRSPVQPLPAPIKDGFRFFSKPVSSRVKSSL